MNSLLNVAPSSPVATKHSSTMGDLPDEWKSLVGLYYPSLLRGTQVKDVEPALNAKQKAARFTQIRPLRTSLIIKSLTGEQ